VVNADNTITVTLALNIRITSADASELTITGLTVTATPSTPTLALTYPTSPPHAFFGASAQWTQSDGTLILRVAASGTGALEAGTLYVFSFQLKNPSEGQPAPALTISGSGTVPLSPVAMVAAPLLSRMIYRATYTHSIAT